MTLHIDIGKNYPNYEEIQKIIRQLCQKFPFLKSEIIGKSLCNRNINCIQIGKSENSVLLAGAFHGMEWQTTLILLKYIDEFCTKILNKTIDFNNKCLKIVPCVNPDGVEIQLNGIESAGEFRNLVKKVSKNETTKWQANARGVDINHNFSAGWKAVHMLEQKSGIIGPNPTRYGGEFPESEPETKALVNFCRKNSFVSAFAFHSQGEEIYYDFGPNTPEKSLKIAQKLAETCGYGVSKPVKIATGAGFKDWFIDEFGKMGFTIEVGKGTNPLPLSDFQNIYQKVSKMLDFIALKM